MIRTGYSFRRAVGHVPEVVSRVKEIGWDVLPVADHTSTFSFVGLTKAAEKEGLRMVYGVRLDVSENLDERWPSVDEWVFLAKRDLRPLHDLIETATSKGKNPGLTYREALSAKGVFKISGEKLLIEHLPKKLPADFFFGLSAATPMGLFRTFQSGKVLALQNNYYPRATDKEFYRVAMPMLKRGKEMSSTASTQTYPMEIVSDEEWTLSVSWFAKDKVKEAVANRNDVLKNCKAVLKKGELLVPEKKKTLRQMCQQGAKLLGVDLAHEVYSKRLDRELEVIKEKKFEDYFYILSDLVSFARTKMVVGPARGSSCGSLVCYLIGITTIDPIPHKLVFERFIDVTRSDLPDIDVDFSDKKRHLVFEYAEKKYGANHVARLGSVGSFQPKSALNQVAAALQIPRYRTEAVTGGIIKRSVGDSRASQTIEDTLTNTDVGKEFMSEYPEASLVSRLEDHPTSAGQHAAGLIITKLPVAEHVAVDRRTGGIMADKKDAEALDLLKIDALGLTQLSIFERTLELIGKGKEYDFLTRVPLDDPEAFEVLNKRYFAGVFQFTGSTVQGITKQLKVDRFDDFVAITALARPGPLGGGGTDEWVSRRNGRKPVKYPHPIFEPYLKDTYGIVVYQEQVLAIGREIGDLSWAEVTKLRQAMSRSLGKEFFDLHGGNKWKARAIEKGIPTNVVEKMWEDLCTFGMWAFNAAHSVAYGTVSYWCCWLKAHYPLEFAAATLDAAGDPAAQIRVLRELRDEGVDYVPVDKDASTDKWVVGTKEGKKLLVGPISSIVGIGPKSLDSILTSRKRGTALSGALAKKLASAKTPIDSLYPIRDAVDRIGRPKFDSDPVEVKNFKADEVTCDTRNVIILGVATKIAKLDENEPVRIAKRGGKKVEGPTSALNMFVSDDTDELFCKIHRRDYVRIGKEIAERGRQGKVIYALKGDVTDGDFRMMWVKEAFFIGEIDDSGSDRHGNNRTGPGKGERGRDSDSSGQKDLFLDSPA